MRRVVRQVEEERFVGLARVIDEPKAEVRPQVCRVPVVAEDGRVARRGNAVEVEGFASPGGQRIVAAAEVLVGEIHAAGAQAQHAVEAALPGWRPVVLAQMPLAGHRGEVAGFAQHLGDRDGAVVEPPGGARRARTDDVVEVAHARLMRVQAGQEACARRRAARRGVELREPDAAAGERVEVRGRNLTAVGTDVGPSHVVDEHDDDVRPGVGASRGRSAHAAGRDEGKDSGRRDERRTTNPSRAPRRHRDLRSHRIFPLVRARASSPGSLSRRR